MKKRLLACLLTAAMLSSLFPLPALAAEDGGLCPHHTEHTEDCGYAEEAKGQPCGYVCPICPVQDMIDALPTAGELSGMSEDGQNGVYHALQAACDAYEALTDGQKEEITGAEIFDSLFAFFNGMVNLLEAKAEYNIGLEAVTIADVCGSGCSGHTITGASDANTIAVAGGDHDITLQSVNIDVSERYRTAAFSIAAGATVNLTLNGENTLKSGMLCAGLQVPNGATLVIAENSTGSLNATGGGFGAGIGGGYEGAGGEITISGGTVDATSDTGAGIGGGYRGAGGEINITDGTVDATSNSSAGIGVGYSGAGGTFTANGNAFIVADSISDQSGKEDGTWKGVIFEGDAGQVYGDSITLTTDAEIPSDKELTIKDGQTLTVGDGVTLTNNGTATVKPGGKLEGDVDGNGEVNLPSPEEQFPNLTPSDTYWFDLSKAGIPGTVNKGNLEGTVPVPDASLHWVPFTYTGTINAYSRTSEGVSTDQDVVPYDHSLFIADYNVTHHEVSWDDLSGNGMIFGTSYISGGVSYTMRAPSAGSNDGTPQSNEWDMTLNKNADYIKNWKGIYSWGQDTHSAHSAFRALRGETSARSWNNIAASARGVRVGFRPVLELPSPDALTSDLKVVTLDLNGGKISSETGPVNIVAAGGEDFTAPSGEGLTRPAGNDGNYFMWKGDDGQLYQAGEAVPADVSELTAVWAEAVAPPIATPQHLNISNHLAKTYTYRLANLRPQLPGGGWKNVTYELTNVTFTQEGYYTAGTAKIIPDHSSTLNTLSLPILFNDVTTEGKVGTVTVKIHSDNYQDFTNTLEIMASNKEAVTFTGVTGVTVPYTGQPVTGYTGELVIKDSGGNPVTLTPEISYTGRLGTSYKGAQPPTGVGTYSVIFRVADTDPKYIGRLAVNFEITRAQGGGDGPGNSDGGNGGGTYTPPSTPAYPPTVEKPSEGGGTPAVSPSNPKPGDTVTVKPKPDEGYEVDKVTVTDKNGKPVSVAEKPDGTYTFTQPDGKVKIEVTYQPIDRPWSNPFADVSKGSWYYEAVRFVQEQGLMNGYSDGRFGANDTLSRAQLAQILFNKEGRPGADYLLNFSDVAGEAWYAEAVRWAASQGIAGGYSNGTFGPNNPITREQLAVMLWRYSGSPDATSKELHFNDEAEISGFALEALRWAVENGILNGYGDGRLGPQGQATQAQVAQMLKNFIENQEETT